jgi:two-component system response regulator AtoC
MRSRILYVSGHPSDANRLTEMLQALPLIVDHVPTFEQARVQIRQRDYDVILTEASLPDGTWLDALHLAREMPKELQVIVTDANADARFWSEVLCLGGYDLVTQPFYEPEVRRILSNACTRAGSPAPRPAV